MNMKEDFFRVMEYYLNTEAKGHKEKAIQLFERQVKEDKQAAIERFRREGHYVSG